MSAPVSRLSFIDGLRALSALYVVLHHALLQVWPLSNLPTGRNLTAFGWLLYGHYAVPVFIVISGYCLMLSVLQNNGVLRGGVRSFFHRRAMRILPAYYGALILSLVLIGLLIGEKTGTHWDSVLPVTVRGIGVHVLLLQNFWSQSQINHVMWSIAVEWQIYLLFPFLVWMWRKYGPLLTTVVSVVASYVFLFYIPLSRLREASPHFLGFFVLGMFAVQVAIGAEHRWVRLREVLPWTILSFVLGSVLMVSFYILGFSGSGHYVPWFDLLAATIAACVLVAATVKKSLLWRTLLEWRPLVYVGISSYSLYLIHAPLLQLVWQFGIHPLALNPAMEFLLLCAVGLPVTLCCARWFFFLFERPFVRSFTPPTAHAAP